MNVCSVHTIFRIPFGMEGLIILCKDVLNRFEKSGVVYKLIFKKCKVTYVGQTGRVLNTRVEEHKKNLGRKCTQKKKVLNLLCLMEDFGLNLATLCISA